MGSRQGNGRRSAVSGEPQCEAASLEGGGHCAGSWAGAGSAHFVEQQKIVRPHGAANSWRIAFSISGPMGPAATTRWEASRTKVLPLLASTLYWAASPLRSGIWGQVGLR